MDMIELFFASNFRLFAKHFLCIFKEYNIEEAGEDKQQLLSLHSTDELDEQAVSSNEDVDRED